MGDVTGVHAVTGRWHPWQIFGERLLTEWVSRKQRLQHCLQRGACPSNRWPRLPPVTDILCRQCGIGGQAANDLYLRLLYQAPGLWGHYHCTELTREAMAAAGLSISRGSFVEAYAGFVLMCIDRA